MPRRHGRGLCGGGIGDIQSCTAIFSPPDRAAVPPSARGSKQATGSFGFTLLEVLVVVAVVGILAALLVPAVLRATEQARAAQCMGNLRSIGSMIQTWTLDNDGVVAPSAVPYSTTWPRMLAMEVMNEAGGPGYQHYPVFYCPTLSNLGCDANSSPTSGYWTNYATNWQVMGTNPDPAATYRNRRLSEFSKPSRTAIIWDSCVSLTGPPARSVAAAAWYHIRAGNPSQSIGWVHGATAPYRRGGAANILFLDGHVESQPDPGDDNYPEIARRSFFELWE